LRLVPPINWDRVTDEQLLDMRVCDLPVGIENTPLVGRIQRLNKELDERSIRFKPHVWLSEEWFTPDEVSGFAIPFYLTHPRLMKLERQQMLEVEGGTERECLRIMRHEAGHALDNAFGFHFEPRYRRLFGSFTRPYPDSYRPAPDSRNYVLHLNAWYAQAHPAEDFAETFAVWLAPGSRWRRRYKDWPALRKLEYVDQLMGEIAGSPAKNGSRRKVEPLAGIRVTLREHYRRKREHYAFEWPANYDRDLKRIFPDAPRNTSHPTAAGFLRRIRRELRHVVAEGTGVHHYAVDQLIKQMVDRSKELKLSVAVPEQVAKQQVIVMLTVQTMSVLQAGYHRVAL
jgi:Putative zinc-binding metallo-peptidase